MCKKGSYKTHIKANYHLNCQFIKLENFGHIFNHQNINSPNLIGVFLIECSFQFIKTPVDMIIILVF